MLRPFLRKWRHRLDFLRRETAAQARGLADLTSALARLPPGDDPPVVLVGNPAVARFLTRFGRLGGLPPADVRVVLDLPALEATLAELDGGRAVIVAAELYTRFHVVLGPDVRAGRLISA